MSGGVGGFTVCLLCAGSFALGVGSMGLYSGAWTTTGAAAEVRQEAVDDAVKVTEELAKSEGDATSKAERVRTIIREVPVPGDCDEYLSDVDADRVQDLFSKTSPYARKRETGPTEEP